MTPDPTFFARCSSSDPAAQWVRGEFFKWADDRSLETFLKEQTEARHREEQWEELEREKHQAEEAHDEAEHKLSDAEDKIEALEAELEQVRDELEEAKSRIKGPFEAVIPPLPQTIVRGRPEKPLGFRYGQDVIRLRGCPDCEGRGWYLIEPFMTGGGNGAGGLGNMCQCLTCENSQSYYEKHGCLPPEIEYLIAHKAKASHKDRAERECAHLIHSKPDL